MTDQLQDLFSFLSLDSRVDLKTIALDYILGLTGSDGGRAMIKASPPVIRLLLQLTSDKQPASISKDANLVLLNLSSSADIAEVMLDLEVIPKLLVNLVNPEYAHSDAICMTLSNLTQTEKGSELFLTAIMKSEQAQKEEQSATASSAASAAAIGSAAVPSLYQLVDIFDRKDFNKRANFHYLATMFLNVTQISLARQMFLDRKKCILPRLIPYTQFYESEIRRGGIVGLLRNLCFDVGCHEWMLSDEVDLLPALLLPLAGPEQFEGEEDKMEQLPEDLQYLPETKQREPDPDIRKMLIETLMKLCSTKFGREYLRLKQVYLIMRELHKWEKEESVKETCEALVSMLISNEPEPGMENLHEVQVPEFMDT